MLVYESLKNPGLQTQTYGAFIGMQMDPGHIFEQVVLLATRCSYCGLHAKI